MAKNLSDLVRFDTSPARAEHYPTPNEKCIEGSPEQFAITHFSADDRFFAGEWGAEVGRWKVEYTENEYFRILSGRSILRDSEGNALELNPGDEVCIPAGFKGDWEVIEPTRKIFVIYEP